MAAAQSCKLITTSVFISEYIMIIIIIAVALCVWEELEAESI